jgi:hypothetical protein
MPVHRAILVDGSRLVREMLRRVLDNIPNFEVIAEVNDWEDLPAVMHGTNADWLFVVLSPEKNLPENITNDLFLVQPKLRIIAFWTDGSHVKAEWLGRKERDFTGLNLSQLTNLLNQEFWTEYSGDSDDKNALIT